ncbi:hypothetical protein [Kribbella sp. CA-293567]|uniref:hypothetical protein n=1 Tax=Kribbella sp. CA-293567 TaxID=3002436 RepID=UPI0022DE5B7A|nr:hypothetical protein [Kribbella sp. CA-293567]WBQ05793.1 hypothetical protein OX958_03070 [Kribbella sp. CA-293567]
MKIHETAVRYAANGWPVAPLAVPHRAGCPCGKACVDPHVVGEVVRDGFRAAEVWPEPPRTAGFDVRRGPTGGESTPRSADSSAYGWDGSPLGGYGAGPTWMKLAGDRSAQTKQTDQTSGRPRLESPGGWGIALVTEWFDVMELPPQYGALLNHHLKASCPTVMAPAKRQWWFFVEQGSVPGEQVLKAGGVLRSGVGDWVPAPGTWSEDTGRIRWLVPPHLTEWRPYRRMDPIDRVFGCL